MLLLLLLPRARAVTAYILATLDRNMDGSIPGTESRRILYMLAPDAVLRFVSRMFVRSGCVGPDGADRTCIDRLSIKAVRRVMLMRNGAAR